MDDTKNKQDSVLAEDLVVADHSDKDERYLHEINEEIYKRNIELAITNKTLSLLRQLYQLSLLTLEPKELSERITETIRLDMNLELAGVFIFDQPSDSLIPLSFSKSERLVATLEKLGFKFRNITIPSVSRHPFFNQAIYAKVSNLSNNIHEVWGGLVSDDKLKTIIDESHVKTTLIFPLQTENNVLGALILGLNRDYESLNAHEKDAIKSFID